MVVANGEEGGPSHLCLRPGWQGSWTGEAGDGGGGLLPRWPLLLGPRLLGCDGGEMGVGGGRGGSPLTSHGQRCQSILQTRGLHALVPSPLLF